MGSRRLVVEARRFVFGGSSGGGVEDAQPNAMSAIARVRVRKPGPAYAEGPASCNGSVILNAAPPPGAFSSEIVPPCCRTIFFTIANPSPVPSLFVVK